MADIVDLARERLSRSPNAELTFTAVLEGIAVVVREAYPDRDSQIEAFGERLTVRIDLGTGQINISPSSREPAAG